MTNEIDKMSEVELLAYVRHLEEALEFISHGYGQGCSADDYGDVAKKALLLKVIDPN